MTSTSSATQGPHLVGTMERLDDTRAAVRMEDVYSTGLDDLWSAVTEPARLSNWIGEITGDDLRQGGTVQGRFTSSWEGAIRVEVCERPHRLLVRLEPDTEDETVVEAWLTAETETSTRLVIEERGLPVDKVHFYGAGWQAHVEDLAAHLRGEQRRDWHTRWTELTPAYKDVAAARF